MINLHLWLNQFQRCQHLLRIPGVGRQTHWLFISGWVKTAVTNPTSKHSRGDLNPESPDFKSNALTTRSRSLHYLPILLTFLSSVTRLLSQSLLIPSRNICLASFLLGSVAWRSKNGCERRQVSRTRISTYRAISWNLASSLSWAESLRLRVSCIVSPKASSSASKVSE